MQLSHQICLQLSHFRMLDPLVLQNRQLATVFSCLLND